MASSHPPSPQPGPPSHPSGLGTAKFDSAEEGTGESAAPLRPHRDSTSASEFPLAWWLGEEQDVSSAPTGGGGAGKPCLAWQEAQPG